MTPTPQKADVPCASDVFKFAKVAACQVTNDPGTKMEILKDSAEQDHFIVKLQLLLEKAEDKLEDRASMFLDHLREDEDVEMFVDFHQLESTGKKHDAKDVWYRKAGEWISPVGDAYKLLSPAKQLSTFKLHTDQVSLRWAKVTKKEIVIPPDTTAHTQCLRLDIYGQVIQFADDKAEIARLLYAFKPESWEDDDKENEDVTNLTSNHVQVSLPTYSVELASLPGSGQQYMHCLLVPPKKKDDESLYVPLCNFWIDKVLNIYQYINNNQSPWYKIRIGQTHDITGLHDYDLNRNDLIPNDTRNVYRTVLLHTCDFKEKGIITMITTALNGNYFPIDDRFTTMRFFSIINQMPRPSVQLVVSNFGRQPDSRVMFFANCIYESGVVMPHEGSGFSLVSEVFNDIGKPTRIDPKNYPEICIIKQHHVRWFILHKMWRFVLPQVCLDNVDAAKNAFAAAMTHLFYGELIENGLNNAVPAPILYSPEGSTGKTYVLKLINAFMGWKPQIKVGAMNTAPAISYAMSHLQADLTYTMDELLLRKSAKNDNAKLKNVIHLTFQAGERAVCNKETEICRSQLCATTNIIPNDDDGSFQTRLLLFQFVKVTEQIDSYAKDQFTALLRLVSALQPDLEDLRHDGKVDRTALDDCARFLDEAACTNNSRSTLMWAYVLYYRLQIEYITLGTPEQLGAVICQVTEQALGAHNDTSAVNNVLNEFLVKFEETRNVSNPLNPHASEVIYLHNFRETLQPPSYPDQWFCMRLKLVTGVVNKTHPECRFTYSEIIKACKQKQYSKDFVSGQAEFFDLKYGWPMKNPLNVMVPLTEDDDWPKIKDTALFVRKSTYVKMIAEKQVGSAASQARLCQINITNNKVYDGEAYNFFDAVTNGMWYGFRAILNTDFRSICGGDNMLMNMENPVQSMDYIRFGNMHRERGYPRVSDCFDFEYLCKTYNTKSFDPKLPPCLKYDCFKYRNAPGDRPQPEDYEDTRPFSPDQASDLPSGDDDGISRPQMHSCIRTTTSSNPDDGEVSDEDAVEDARGENLMDSDGESEVISTLTHAHSALFVTTLSRLRTAHVRDLRRPRFYRRRRRAQPDRGRAPHGLCPAERGRRRLHQPAPRYVPVPPVRRAGP